MNVEGGTPRKPSASGGDRGADRPAFTCWLIAIVVLACAARAAILAYAEFNPRSFDFPDTHRYIRLAENIAAGRGPIESDEVRAGTDPLYPMVLAIGVRLGCGGTEAVLRFGRVFNAVVGVASVGLLAVLGRRLLGARVGLVAAAILAVDPILVFFNGLVLTETVYIGFSLLGFYGVVRTGDPRGWVWSIVAGVAMGLACVTRSSGVLLPLFMVPFLWHFAGGRARRRASVAALYAAAWAVALLPTTARNYRLFSDFVLVRTGGGASLLEAFGPWADGGPGMERIVYPVFPPGADEHVRDRICRQAAMQWASQHPQRALSLAWTKLRRTWSVGMNAADYSSTLYTAMCWLSVAPEFILAALGAWMLRRRPVLLVLLILPAIYFTLVHMVYVGSVRYRVPAMPFLFVLAGAAVEHLWTKTGQSHLRDQSCNRRGAVRTPGTKTAPSRSRL